MGTNFYAILPVKQETKDKFYKLAERVSNNNLDDVKWDLFDLQEELDTYKIHLGKRSYGWAFLWDLNNLKYYEPTLESIKEFIDKNNATIQNEYSESFTWEQFINDEIGECMKVHTAMIDGKERRYDCSRTYHESHKTEIAGGYRTSESEKMEDKLKNYKGNLDAEYAEYFNEDGMRFALFTNFC